MSIPNPGDRAFSELEDLLKRDEEQLRAKKGELDKIDAENRQAAATITDLQKKMKANDLHKKTVDMEMKAIMNKERDDQMRLTRMQQENQRRMQQRK